MTLKPRLVITAGTALCITLAQSSHASEYLGNNQRTGYTDAAVPASPVLLWTYKERHPPMQSWPEPRHEAQFIDYDYADQATMDSGMVFLGSSADHTVRALDVSSGEEQWAFHTEGPVRFAPVLYKDRVCVVSDDGYLYCLKARDGSLVWKRRLAPGTERCIGNEQMVSKWPCRSGVLIEGDRLYATAGMWSGEGVFIYCLSADSGEVIWKNDTTGHRWMHLPHSVGYGGVAPQGYLAFYRGILYVAAGRAAPAIFDAKTGTLLYHEIGRGYKAHYPGGSWIMASHDWIIYKRRQCHEDADVRYDEREPRGAEAGIILNQYRTGEAEVALTEKSLGAIVGDDMILAGAGPVIRINIGKMRERYEGVRKSGAAQYKNADPPYMSPSPLAEWEADIGRVYSLMVAGSRIIAGGRGVVSMLDAGDGRTLWQRKVEGNVFGISVSDGRFTATTTAGYVYCFGAGTSDSTDVRTHQPTPAPAAQDPDSAAKVVEGIGIDEGYCLMLGVGDGGLLLELLRNTKLVVYCLEPDSAKRQRMQALLDRAGLLGKRAQLHEGSFDGITYAPYAANCIIWGSRLGSSPGSTDFKGLYRSLRPWGGIAYEYGDGSAASASRAGLTRAGVPEGEISVGSFGSLVTRGPLPGAGEWTRAHADTGNTFSSGDAIVKLPLGILWWGGVGPGRIVSRHWRAPVPLFSKGRMFIQGQHDIIGVDAYTGREMWNRHIEGIGRFPPTLRGGNIITDGERVYCVKGLTCYALDAKSGKTVKEYRHNLSAEQITEAKKFTPQGDVPLAKRLLPVKNQAIEWEYLGMSGGRILGTISLHGTIQDAGHSFSSPSRHIFAYDKETGGKAWEITLENTVTPSAIVSDDTHLYSIDRTDEDTYLKLSRRGDMKGFASALRAVRLSDGQTVWQNRTLKPERKALFLKDGVIVASANFNENATDMNAGLSGFSAADGKLLWNIDDPGNITKSRRGGPVRKVFIVGDTLYLPYAVDLRTGQEKLVCKEPLTGAPSQFRLSGQNFCGTVAAGAHILAYRSAGLGFRSLTEDSPCYWLPEKRPSCWISLLPAGGIMLAPEGASTCVCSYNYKTSLALVPVERHESWGVYLTGNELPQGGGLEPNDGDGRRVLRATPFNRLNLNLNAPGDHYDRTGGGPFIAWPQATHPTAKFPMLHAPVAGAEDADGFRFNTDFHPVAGTARPWIYASGLTGEITLKVAFIATTKKTYRVVLHFMEPERIGKGGRVFNVLMDGKTVLSRVDIAGEAGEPNKALVKEVNGVTPSDTLEISLKSVSGKPPLLCGVEIIPE